MLAVGVINSNIVSYVLFKAGFHITGDHCRSIFSHC
jgi:hypothetical protein